MIFCQFITQPKKLITIKISISLIVLLIQFKEKPTYQTVFEFKVFRQIPSSYQQLQHRHHNIVFRHKG